MRDAAAQAGIANAAALPLLPPEAAIDLATFTRRYFRALFASLPRHAHVVIDNFQDAEGPAFETMMRVAFEQVPDEIHVLVLSLADPPESLARLLANQRIGSISPDELRLLREESDELVRSRLPLDEDALAALYERSGGWAAGIVLMTEHMRRTGSHSAPGAVASQGAVFDYFAG